MKKEIPWLLPTQMKNVMSDVFLLDNSCYPKVVQLFGVDGNMEHGVTVLDNYIFDSNHPTALPLTQDNMNFCCSTPTEKGTFHHVHRGVEYRERPEKKRKWLQLGRDRNMMEPYSFREFPTKKYRITE